MFNPILLNVPAVIETDRLILRHPRAGDGAALHEAVSESISELRKFLASIPWIAVEQTVESSEIYCRTAESNFLARKDLPYLLWDKKTHEVVGGTGLHRSDWNTPKTEVGYLCRTSRCGAGIATEAVNALSGLALRKLAVARLELVTDEANSASRRVAERCGFILEGILRNERRAPDGTLRHTCIYAKLSTAS